jgi:ApbE superfamily uncharacterized protein (UPF0280 family)
LYEPRIYREEMNRDRFRFFPCTYFETDLLIGVPHSEYKDDMKRSALSEVMRIRSYILEFSTDHPSFITSLEPLDLPDMHKDKEGGLMAPDEIVTMLRCGMQSGTGPMSSVAGLFAQQVGNKLKEIYGLTEVLVENGGDLYVENRSGLNVVIHAGSSPISGKMALSLPPGLWGVCTSSGTVGHSLSFGLADAVTVIAREAPMSDAWATSLANRVRNPGDIESVLEMALGIPEILGCVVIVGDRIGIRGQFEVKPLS